MAFPQLDPKNGLAYDSEAVKKLGESLNDAKEKEEYGKFVEFMKKYDRKYVNEEELKKRFGVFQQSLARAAEQQKKDTGTAVYGPTKFSDYTLEEFKKMNGARPPK
ncbi:unnamed protein product [Bursaphelenchus xylophilus]|uniref:(pine wood nematode) hypothetical protein n=1 Tax=Bursaphelenchus xylophilus TaxID=6326 RepID=A0A1I7RWI8_BURXY|nr:unnamed protein product [Bursaphelenchus xylophilus]CAG9128412.1 unnamed protein product [Bursaphelenchus xylophilus]